jgi:hypothetical protein
MGMRHMVQTGLVVALMAGMASAAAMAQTASLAGTHTTLNSETREVNGKTVATFTAAVESEDGSPATGAITLSEHGKDIAGAALNSEGLAELKLNGLTAGDHTLSAIYQGDKLHAASKSDSLVMHPEAVSTPTFAISVAPATLTVAAPGDATSLVATVTPQNGFKGFISLSCSGDTGGASLPVGLTCNFTPLNLQITGTSAVIADLTVQTSAPQQVTKNNAEPLLNGKQPLLVAILLPGILGLGFVARKRKHFGSAVLLLLVGAVTVLGTTGCNARYRYLNHGPTFGGTPTGSYTLTVTAQTSNGVTATANSTTFVLTVQ